MPNAIMQGTMDLLILKALSLGEQHGYGVLLRIEQLSGGEWALEQGALYPALYRLEAKGWIKATWGVSDNNRRAKFYGLTAAGKKQLRLETEHWRRTVELMNLALGTEPS